MASTKRPTRFPKSKVDLKTLLSRAAILVRERVAPLPNVLSPRSKNLRPRIHDAKKTPGVCPYCAVGCGTLMYSHGDKLIDIEGNPDSPISGGTLCPKGSATFQLHVNDNRVTTPKYRAPYATEWQDVSYDWILETVSQRVKETRERTFTIADEHGHRVNRTMAIGSLGGATLDNEENYLIAKLFRSIGTPFIENQARI